MITVKMEGLEENKPPLKIDFSPKRVSQVEYNLLLILAKNEFAMSTYEIYQGTLISALDKIYHDKISYKRFLSYVDKNKKIQQHLTEARETGQPKFNRILYEEEAKILRDGFGYDIPTYPRVLRILKSMATVGWVIPREVFSDSKKENTNQVWSIDDDVRSAIKNAKV